MAAKSKTVIEEDEWPPAPRANPHLSGHETAEQILFDAFASGRMHHAWLLSGPKGIGKATLAHRFARYILNRNAIEPEAPPPDSLFGDVDEEKTEADASPLYTAPETTLFQRTAAGGHADLFCIERRVNEKTGKLKTVIDVDSVRGVGKFLSLTAAEGGWRVVIVDSADEMNPNAANAILKVLEEPPKNTVLLLVSHSPGRLLPTIRSRCRKLVLAPLEPEAMLALVQNYICGPDVNKAQKLAALSEGSIGRAVQLNDAGGVELWTEMNALLDTLPRLDVARLHKLADKAGRQGAEETFDTLAGLYRWSLERLILDQSGHKAGGEGESWMGRIGPEASLDRWFKVWEKSAHLVARAGAVHLDRKQVVLDLFLGLESTVNSPRA